MYICLFFIRFTLPRGSSSFPCHPGQTDDIFRKIKTHFTHTNVYFIEHCTLTFFNILTPKICRIPKNNHTYIIHTLGDTWNFPFHFTPLSPKLYDDACLNNQFLQNYYWQLQIYATCDYLQIYLCARFGPDLLTWVCWRLI